MSAIANRLRQLVSGDAATGGPVQANWNGVVIAESDHTVKVEGNHYFPPEAVKNEYLKPSPHHTTCPWKGTASYYDVVVDGERNSGAAWSYPSPKSAAKNIKDHVAFWHGVKVKRTPAA